MRSQCRWSLLAVRRRNELWLRCPGRRQQCAIEELGEQLLLPDLLRRSHSCRHEQVRRAASNIGGDGAKHALRSRALLNSVQDQGVPHGVHRQRQRFVRVGHAEQLLHRIHRGHHINLRAHVLHCERPNHGQRLVSVGILGAVAGAGAAAAAVLTGQRLERHGGIVIRKGAVDPGRH